MLILFSKPSGGMLRKMRAVLKLYRPTGAQLQGHISQYAYNVFSFGRQSGKSTYGNNKLLDKAWKKKDGMYWYLGPTYRLAEQMHDRAKFSIHMSGAMKDKSDSDLMIQLKSGSRIFYKSGDNPGALLGETLDGAIIDECREQKKELWTHYIMPMLGTTHGWCDFLSTPNGFDWFYDLYQNHQTKPNWGAFHAPSHSNPLWSKEMLEEAKESMSEDLYAQEILAEFRDIGSGTCYVSFGQHNISRNSPFAVGMNKISPYLPILVGMDFNLSPMCWILGQNRNRDFHWHSEIVLQKSHTEEAAKVLVERVKNHAPGIIICGDASGKAGQRAAAAGQSDYDVIKGVLKANGIKYSDKTPDANPGIKDRVNTVNAACRSADGSIHMTLDPECKIAIKDMQRRAWKEGGVNLAFDNSQHDIGHMSDALGYCCVVFAPIKPVGGIGRVRVISRSI